MKGFSLQQSKQKVTKVVSLEKMVENVPTDSEPLKYDGYICQANVRVFFFSQKTDFDILLICMKR